jgi:hypothetical protein
MPSFTRSTPARREKGVAAAYRVISTSPWLKRILQFLFVALPFLATWEALAAQAALKKTPQPLFTVGADYHWIFFILSAPVYWLALDWLFNQFYCFICEILTDHWGGTSDAQEEKMEKIDIIAPGLLGPWRTRLIWGGQSRRFLLTSWLFLPILLIVALILLRLDYLSQHLVEVAHLRHWATTDPIAHYSIRLYGLMVICILPHLWLRVIQYLEITRYTITGRAVSKAQHPLTIHPDGCFGLGRSWIITVAIGLAIFALGAGWLVAIFLTLKPLRITDPAFRIEALFLALLCFYFVFAISSVLPLAWAHAAIKQRKHALLSPWRNLERDVCALFLSQQSTLSRDQIEVMSARMAFVKCEIDNIQALPELPARFSRVLSFLAIQMIPAILSVALLIRQIFKP